MYPTSVEIPKVSTAETLDIIAKAKDRIEKDVALGKKETDKNQWMQRVLDVLNDSEEIMRKTTAFEAAMDSQMEKLR